MKIATQTAVSMHYTLTNSKGEQLDSSIGDAPLVYLQGANNIVPGLETALMDKEIGDKVNVTVAAVEAYGVYDDTRLQVVDKKMFEGVDKLEVGMVFHADASHGVNMVTITKIADNEITIDGNHPLAGEDLTFDVEIMAVRAATAEELTNGHIHSGSCQHD